MQGIAINVNRIGARGDIALLKIKGYVDTTTSTEVSGYLSNLLHKNIHQFIVDMGGVNYVSSAGWGVFVGELRGIREYGGDLKIAQMTPDVYEVFAMLEFNKILDYYEAIEEAINDFDIMMGLDLTKSIERKPVKVRKEDVTVGAPADKAKARASTEDPTKKKKKWSSTSKTSVDEVNLPLAEKVKIIVIEDPNKGILKIQKELNTKRFGFHKTNVLKLRKILKDYNLETKEKRHRFYRSR
ncbi:anti-sigma factor antagonist [candidate division KSB1 bacterium]|nr:anti-sigma factor antagonist [candidate division KSB1 bacterium]